MMAFLVPPLNANQKTRFEKLIDIIKAEMPEHLNLLAAREAQPGDTLRDIHKLTQDYVASFPRISFGGENAGLHR